MDLHHVRRGSGPPLLLLHGIGMSHAAFDGVVPRLEGRFEVFAADLPGFGRSPALDGPANVAALARACAEFMSAQGHERFHVAGNSLGGGIALHLALTGTALSACALSPIGFVEGWERPYLHLSLIATRGSGHVMPRLSALLRPAGARRAALAQMVAHGERVPHAAVISAFGDLTGCPGFHSARRHALNWRFPHRASFGCPVTIGWGERDRLLLYAPQSARAIGRAPDARHVTLFDCGHLPAWDDPAQVADVIREAAAPALEPAARVATA